MAVQSAHLADRDRRLTALSSELHGLPSVATCSHGNDVASRNLRPRDSTSWVGGARGPVASESVEVFIWEGVV